MVPSTGEVLRGLVVSGGANFGSQPGLAYSLTYYIPSGKDTAIGIRLVFHP